MTTEILLALGGLGLFLVGMHMLTEGLRGLAGRALRDLLARFTSSPFTGAVAGAGVTAVIQSSSATTVTVVGFVGAGLLTFPQALGVIFGANVGTTFTGWMVAVLGFKLKLGELVLPLVLLGAVLKLAGNARLGLVGTALVGFSLLFIGLDTLQRGLSSLQGVVTPEDFPGDSLLGRIELVAIGATITAVTQSSSAGVVAALVALGAGAISFGQAAAMVVGMNVGTTVTALLATLGGSTATRRTGFAHLIFNLQTGVVAFALLDAVERLARPLVEQGEAQLALVAFHTTFNLLGTAMVLPFTAGFARLVTALVPERGPRLTRRLGNAILRDPDAATDAAAATVSDIAWATFDLIAYRLRARPDGRAGTAALRDIADALADTRGFVERIVFTNPSGPGAVRLVEAMHILDHLGRLYFRCTETERIDTMEFEPRLRRLRSLLGALALVMADPEAEPAEIERRINRLRKIMRGQRERFRARTIALASTGRIEGEVALHRLDSVRWLHRVSYHLWRIQHHLNVLAGITHPATPRREAAVEVRQD